MTSITIRRKTFTFDQAIAASVNATCYSLSNGFSGKVIPGKISAFDVENGKLVRLGGTYTLRVHSNLWYEWAA